MEYGIRFVTNVYKRIILLDGLLLSKSSSGFLRLDA